MERADEIFAEIHKLICEQLRVLRGTLSSSEWGEYIQRKKKIEELLHQIKSEPVRTSRTGGAVVCRSDRA